MSKRQQCVGHANCLNYCTSSNISLILNNVRSKHAMFSSLLKMKWPWFSLYYICFLNITIKMYDLRSSFSSSRISFIVIIKQYCPWHCIRNCCTLQLLNRLFLVPSCHFLLDNCMNWSLIISILEINVLLVVFELFPVLYVALADNKIFVKYWLDQRFEGL